MIVRIIGGHGGVSPSAKATSYLIDGKLLIDAGSVAEGIVVEEQLKIDNILISHSHLDHIKDLAFITDNCFGMKNKPFEVYSHEKVIEAIKKHIMNGEIWPDFSTLPSVEKPTIRFNSIVSEQVLNLSDGYEILPVSVNHPAYALGFIVTRKGKSVLFTQDTGPTKRIWEKAKELTTEIKAIFTEVSFPNDQKQVAKDSQHHTPDSLKEEIKKMPDDIPIFVGHLKPAYQGKLYEEIEEMNKDNRIVILGSDDRSYVF